MPERVGSSMVRWRAIAISLCAIGMGISGYTLWVHYQPSALVCANAGPVDCTAVLTSPQSVIFGVPVPYIGLAFFLTMGILNLSRPWSTAWSWVHWGRLALAVCGVGGAIYFLYTELFTIDKICLWCSSVHLVAFALFAIVVIRTPDLLVQNTLSHESETRA
jgi:uncharacterized membrane protein